MNNNEKCDAFARDVLKLAVERRMTNGEFVSTVVSLTYTFMCISLGAETKQAQRSLAITTRNMVTQSFDAIIGALK